MGPEKIPKPEKDLNYLDKLLLKKEASNYSRNKDALTKDLKGSHQIIKGHCDNEMVAKLHTFDEFRAIDKAQDAIELLAPMQ